MAGSASRTSSRTISRPKLRDLSLHLKAMLPGIDNEEEVAEIDQRRREGVRAGPGAGRDRRADRCHDRVYWMEGAPRRPGQRPGRQARLCTPPR